MKKLLFSIALVFVISFVFTSCKNEEKKKVETKEVKKQVATAVYQCPMDCEKGKTYDKEGNCPVCKMKLKKVEKMAAVYQCPMDCEKGKTYDKPGKCPVCKMDLKKKMMKDHAGHNH